MRAIGVGGGASRLVEGQEARLAGGCAGGKAGRASVLIGAHAVHRLPCAATRLGRPSPAAPWHPARFHHLANATPKSPQVRHHPPHPRRPGSPLRVYLLRYDDSAEADRFQAGAARERAAFEALIRGKETMAPAAPREQVRLCNALLACRADAMLIRGEETMAPLSSLCNASLCAYAPRSCNAA